jgi:hypothetical protein
MVGGKTSSILNLDTTWRYTPASTSRENSPHPVNQCFLMLKYLCNSFLDLGLIGVPPSQLYQNQLTKTGPFPRQAKIMRNEYVQFSYTSY